MPWLSELGVPVPTSHQPSLTSIHTGAERLPANIIQAQRDYFGAHTYERVMSKEGNLHYFMVP